MGVAVRLLSFVFFLSFGAQARPLQISCEMIPELVNQVQQSVSPNYLNQYKNFNIKKMYNGLCSIELSDLLSNDIKYLTDKPMPFDGVNCWGSVLFLRGLRSHAIYAHDSEFKWFMNQSQACRQLSEFEPPQAGDLGAMRIKTSQDVVEELHAFIYLNSEYAISKQSYSFEAELELTNVEYFNKAFGTPGVWTDYYRCEKKLVEVESLDVDNATFAEINALVVLVEHELKNGNEIGKDKNLESHLLNKIELINHKLYATNPAPVLQYGRLLFESAIWQFTAVQSGLQTPLEPASK